MSYPEAEKHFSKSTPEVNQTTLSYSEAVSSVSSPTKHEVSIQTDLTWPNNLTSPVLHHESFISNEKSVNTDEMEIENANMKRGRESLSSLDENDLPSMTRTTKKCFTSLTKSVNNVSVALSAEGAQGGEEEGGKHQRPPDGEEVRSEDEDVPGQRPPPLPPSSSTHISRPASKHASRSDPTRNWSPIKNP